MASLVALGTRANQMTNGEKKKTTEGSEIFMDTAKNEQLLPRPIRGLSAGFGKSLQY